MLLGATISFFGLDRHVSNLCLVLPALQVVRECTDAVCSILWLVAFCAMLVVVLFGTYKPERHDFVRLTNDRGVQCGVYDMIGKDSGDS